MPKKKTTMQRTRHNIILILLLLIASNTMGQRFINLTADEVTIDSVMPVVSYALPLPSDYSDSIYTAEILYPEFLDMDDDDIARYNRIASRDGLPSLIPGSGVGAVPPLPSIHQDIVVSRKKPVMLFTLTPVAYNEGRYRFLVSFMLKITSKPADRSMRAKADGASGVTLTRGTDISSRYAQHSVLSSGKWAKIRVPKTGFYELTADVVRKAGFKDIENVHIYGYGGNLVPEVLTPEYLSSHDDLSPTAVAIVNGKRVFYARGPVSWSQRGMDSRTRNPYSDYGYYFITELETPQETVSADVLKEEWRADCSRYYSLYEQDAYAWFHGGRNLVEKTEIRSTATTTAGGSGTTPRTLTIPLPDHADASAGGELTVVVSSSDQSGYSIELNDSLLGSGACVSSDPDHDKAIFASSTFPVDNLKAVNTIKVSCTYGGPLRLDYAMIYANKAADDINLDTLKFDAAEYVHNITLQDHHADEAVDLTIIIPTSQKLLEQAKRLKELHEQKDGMTVRIVPADELYNEFSSGTPDVSAYRRYMKMLYDRATDEASQPKYLLLLGDGVWDNRLLTDGCRTLSADDMLLCFESENSTSEVHCYVSDDFIGLLDDNESLSTGALFLGIPDIGIGRIPVTSPEAAKAVVNKIIAYKENKNVGTWQNTLCFMGDDGNYNLHMSDADRVAEETIVNYPGYNIRKVMWDMYKRNETSVGSRYPECETIIKSQQQSGALIMNYAGHGAVDAISHEYVLTLNDFDAFTNTNLPLWFTASCDIGPFDGISETIGESVVTNPNGGGIAFYGTTRTVYAYYNTMMNSAFTRYALSRTGSQRTTLGDANRLAKQYLVETGRDRTDNKLQYSLLGDPALSLNTPLLGCVVDSINGIPTSGGTLPELRANSRVRIAGHITDGETEAESFNGLVSVVVKDNRELRTCLMNDPTTETAFQFFDRTKTLFSGTDSVRNGRFAINFVVPKDINYSGEQGLITLFAYNADGSETAHGESEHFTVGGSEEIFNDSIGPSVYCYLNTPQFVNGGDVNSTPFFVAEIRDSDGINASGAGIGHDMMLFIDNDVDRQYSLNDNFQYDFGSYTSGSTYYSIPELTPGRHQLRFRVWDIMNNPTTTTLQFNVVSGLSPSIIDINATRNPAREQTSFIVQHDRPGSAVDISIDIFDTSGRHIHSITSNSLSGESTLHIDWNLLTSTGGKIHSGVYLYRVSITCDGSRRVSKAKKIIIL